MDGATGAISAERFRISVPDEVLADLRERLARTRWPRPAAGPDWAMGTSLPFMAKVVDRWRDGYDWRAWEARLNSLEQYRILLGGMRIHAFVERGSGPNPMPLVMTHGWPGSPIELLDMVAPLAHPEWFGGNEAEAFTVVVPSLPGCGFSEAPAGPISPREVGRLWAQMMREGFGFERYMAHGGDWGAVVSSWMGVDKAPGLLGLHLNTAVLQNAASVGTEPLTPEEAAHMERMAARQAGETAYQQAHGFKPLSLAYAMTDSPAGIAAWILEKFHDWTIKGQERDPPFDLDHLISNIMFYWLGDSHAASWMYRYLVDRSGFILPPGERCALPTGFCLFPEDIAVPPPDALLRRAYDMIHITRASAGGHFPGMEHPEVLANDIRTFRRKLETAS
ncbi:MAG: epoxide hydrolase [Phenylobacterium sp.]|nr:epoxide hydrolase [Phenylobacterium sp.]